MNRPFLLLTALAATTLSLVACDARKLPGEDPQREGSFSDAPPANATVTDLDSVNETQTVPPPIGKGSANDTDNSVQSDLNSAPAGGSATTPTNASGTPGNINNATPTKGDGMSTPPKQ